VLEKSASMAFWPPKQRIDASLGKERDSRVADVKKRGARSESEFYRKHGVDGKPGGEVRRRTHRRQSGGDEVRDEATRGGVT
jgi:hypothetical protein